ncbi:cobalamin biosynthesis protein CobD [Desulfuribacillus stibiiarsenatis]|uniref:Cobalamin biosynthesis protein CobD n=1 Tax=Desulfuribacillus stibiiarsenatis TaxID=1390249 RepID=A0A1E5L3U6_9FIRM|nr:adenosylcobinamide-phosphate synthase CbiB [Desulfuribacillus stibiiarsenatis]OEH84764.1 cobalamin biosynthesis protein CobD [Desulfuribacillus stibiiarsenatis]
MFFSSSIVIFAIMVDRFIGDPKRYHPVVLIGYMISKLEQILYPQLAGTPFVKKFLGGVLVSTVIIFTWVVSYYVYILVFAIHHWLGYAIAIYLMSLTMTWKGLRDAAVSIYMLLMDNRVQNARHEVGMIVGRDTVELNDSEISRATIESVSENLVDGVIAPVFYGFLFGMPSAFVYRSINTMDSMLGYKNERYADFGFCAAKIDDVMNWIPARISYVLIMLAVMIGKFHFRLAALTVRNDAAKHPSPNSGIPESAFAGALNVQLGGTNYYQGTPSFRAYLNEFGRKSEPIDIKKAVQLLDLTMMITVSMLGIIAVLIHLVW